MAIFQNLHLILQIKLNLWLYLVIWVWYFCDLYGVLSMLLIFWCLLFQWTHMIHWIFIRFLTKLLTEDLPQLFVRPKKIVLDFQKGTAVGPVANDFRSGEMQEGNTDFVGELSVTLVDARKLSYFFFGKDHFPLFYCVMHISWSLSPTIIFVMVAIMKEVFYFASAKTAI